MWELGVGAHYISDDLTLAFHLTKLACNPVNYTYSTEYLAGFTPCSFPPNHVLAQEMQFTHTEPWSHVYILPHGGLVSEYQTCVYTDVVLNVSFINWMRHLMTIRNNEHLCSCLKHTYSFKKSNEQRMKEWNRGRNQDKQVEDKRKRKRTPKLR